MLYIFSCLEHLIEHYPYAIYLIAIIEGILCGTTIFSILIISAYPNILKIFEIAFLILLSTISISSLSFFYSASLQGLINRIDIKNIEQIKEYIKYYSSLILLFFRFLPIPLSVFIVPIIMGYSGINSLNFYILNILGSILWVSGLTILFCIIGKSLGQYLYIIFLIIPIYILYKTIKELF